MEQPPDADHRLRVLLAHERAADARAAERILKAADGRIVTRQVRAKSSFLAALTRFKPHAIVMDCGLRNFSPLAALDVLKERGGIPLFVIAAPNETAAAVASVKAGAAGWIPKADIERLPSALLSVLKPPAATCFHESEERYRAFVAQSTEGIWRFEIEEPFPVDLPVDEQIDRFYRYAYLAECNDAMARMYGFSRAANMVGIRIGGILIRSDEGNLNHLRRLIRSGYRIAEDESHEVDGAGNNRYFLNNVLGVVENGLLRRFWGTQRDITERKRTEDALRASEARYRLLFEVNPHPMWVYDLETMGFLAVNDAAIKHYGYTRDEFLRMTIKDIRPPEDVARLLAHLAAVPEGLDAAGIWRHCKKNGTSIDVEITAHTIDFAGRRAEIVLASDITERKRAEEALRGSEERYRLLFDSNPLPMYLVDHESLRFLAVNDASLRCYGYSRDEFLTMTLKDTRPLDEIPGIVEFVAGLAPGSHAPRAAQHRKKDGTIFDVEATGHTFQHGGKLISLVLVNDVTARLQAERERQIMERKLQETQKLESLGVLAGGIAHDFNNLLATILGNVGLATMQASPIAPVRPYLTSIEIAAHRAADLCKQMLAYAGKGRFSVQPININTVIQEIANLLRVSIGKGILLKFDLAPSLPLINADAIQIRQVVMNLIINASEAIGDNHGAISLATGVTRATRAMLAETYLAPDLPDSDYLVLEVTDTGCGMDEQTRARIFDPFYSTKFAGRGLGLAATLGIVRGHGGAIKVESAPGHGTTFRILLPCAGAASAAPEAPRSLPGPPLSGTVLVVQADETLRTLHARMLEAMGLRTLLAADMQHAMEALAANPEAVSLALLDAAMPDCDADTAHAQIRRIRPDLPLILLSAFARKRASEQHDGKQRRTHFLQTPLTVQQLYEQLRAALKQ